MGRYRRGRVPDSSSSEDSDDSGDEQHYVQRGNKWVPIDLGGARGAPSTGGGAREEYFVQRGGKWVKVEGATSADHAFQKLSLVGQMPSSRSIQQTTLHPPTAVVAHPPAPIYVVMPPPAQAAPPPQPDPFPDMRRALPNDYVQRPSQPIRPQRRDDYRDSPPPMRRMEYSPPPPRRMYRDSPPPPRSMPPPPMRRMPPPPRVDAFSLGREAFMREMAMDNPDDYDCAPPEPPREPVRTSAAPGYYLAGYLLHGGAGGTAPAAPVPPPPPSQVQAAAPQAPPGFYLAGYSSGGDSCAPSPAQPGGVQLPPQIQIPGLQAPGLPGQIQQVGAVQGYPTAQMAGYPVQMMAGNQGGLPAGQPMMVYDGYGPAYAG